MRVGATSIRVARSRCEEVEPIRPGSAVPALMRSGPDPLVSPDEFGRMNALAGEPLLLADRMAAHLADAALRRPLLIAVDDLHWADRTGRFLLRTLIARLAARPIVWMMSGRTDDVGADLIGREPIPVLRERLDPLGRAAVTAMARDRWGEPLDDRTLRHLDAAAGNPAQVVQIMAGLAGDLRAAPQHVRNAVVQGDPGDAETLLPSVQCARMWSDYNLGRFAEADADAAALSESSRQSGAHRYLLEAVTIRAAVALSRGDAGTADTRLAAAADEVAATEEARDHPGIAVTRGWLAAVRGDRPGALDRLRPVLASADPAGHWPLWPVWLTLIFSIAAAAGDQDLAAAAVEAAELAARHSPGVASTTGVALWLRGEHENRLDLLAEAVRVLAGSPRPMLRAGGARAYGRALLAADRRADGLAELERARSEYDAVGAGPDRIEVQELMEAVAGRNTRTTGATDEPVAGWAGLTGAERRVALLVGAGHTNKGVASELGVSVNTVGTHIRSVFTKLGVQSRVQLANLLHHEAHG